MMQLGNAFYHGEDAVTLAGFSEKRNGFVLVSKVLNEEREYQWVSVQSITAIPLDEDWIGILGCNRVGGFYTWGSYQISRIGDQHFRISLAGNEIKVVKWVHELQNFLNFIRS